MHHWIRMAIPLAAVVSAAGAHAQSIAGFKVGDDLRVVAKSHPAPFLTEPLGSYTASKWDLPKGNTVSVTAAPGTGRIVFIESDWGGDPAGAATDVPGIQFGSTTLADIRKRFRSNGFAFKENFGQVTDDNLVSFNCYQIDSDPDLIVVFVTTLLSPLTVTLMIAYLQTV